MGRRGGREKEVGPGHAMKARDEGGQPPLVALRVWVCGRVQGVGFRDFACRQARRLGVRGYVRNLADGRVEAYAEGPADRVQALVEALRRGPTAARVEGVDTEPVPPQGRYADFEIRYF